MTSTTTIDPSQPLLLTSTTPHLPTLLTLAVHLHAHCILHSGTLATFLPPLSHPKMLTWWQSRLDEVSAGQRHIILYLLPVSSRTTSTGTTTPIPDPIFAADPPSPTAGPLPTITLNNTTYDLAGLVTLSMPPSETGPMRGLVEKLFTSPHHRRKGVARTVMSELERVARREGRWNLLLDTTVGSEAEGVYPRLGWERCGFVREYGVHPGTGEWVDEVWFGKDLR